jgi:hypothetical protein
VHPFERGKRAGHSPAQLVGLDVPDDVLTLLGLDPKESPLVDGENSAVTNSPLSDLADSFFSLCYSPIMPWSAKKCQSNSLEF